MDVLMIGGTRFIGRIAVQKLLDRGDSVTVFSRGNSKPDWWRHVEHIQGDRFEVDDFKNKLKGRNFDAVIDSQAYNREHVEATIDAFKEKLGRYLFVSSAAVYGTQDDWNGKIDWFSKSPFKEEDVNWTGLDDQYGTDEHPYAAGKRRAEKWLMEKSSVPYTIIRIPAMLGEDDNEERSWWWSQRAMDGRPIIMPAENRGMFRCLYSGDAAEAYVSAIREPKAANQAYHVATHEIISVEHWARLVCKITGHESTLTFVPRKNIMEDQDLARFVRYYSRLARPFPFLPDLTKAKSDFGFKTTPLHEWVGATVEWYINEYNGEDSAGYEVRESEVDVAKFGERHSFITNSL